MVFSVRYITPLRIVLALLFGTFFFQSSYAQVQFLGQFTPATCESSAKKLAEGLIPNPELTGILALGISFDLGPQPLSLGMSVETGASVLWIYLFRSATADTSVTILQGRMFGSCIDPSILLGDIPLDFPISGEVGTNPIPANYINGTAIFAALKTSTEFNAYRAKYPKSEPFVSAISAFDNDGKSEPLWLMTWTPDSTNNNSSLTCFVHAVTSETFCLGEVTSVDEFSGKTSLTVHPNPATNELFVQVPDGYSSEKLSVEFVSAQGDVISRPYQLLSDRVILIETSSLPSGNYSVLIRTPNSVVSASVVIVK